MVKFDCAILKITRRSNLGKQEKIKTTARLINHAGAAAEPDCCLGKPLRGIIGNAIASQGLILSTLQTINRSIDQTRNDVH